MPKNTKEEPFAERPALEAAVAEGGLEGMWPPKWMTTYTDLTTLLMTFFVLWYALTMMKIPKELWQIREREDESLSLTEESEVFLGKTNLLEDTFIWQEIEKMSPEERLRLSDVKTLRDTAFDVQQYLEMGELKEGVEMKIEGEDVVIVPSAALLFPEGSATIKTSFFPVLDKIAWILKETKASIRIEGHTDDIPIHPKHRQRFPSNYELSAGRAIAVARYLIDRHNIPPERIAVAGYGPLLPQYPNDDPENKSLNRRVGFHIFISSETTAKEG